MSRAKEALIKERSLLLEQVNENKKIILKCLSSMDECREQNSLLQAEVDYIESVIQALNEAEVEVQSEQEQTKE